MPRLMPSWLMYSMKSRPSRFTVSSRNLIISWNFHVVLSVDPNDHSTVARMEEFHSRLVRRALAMEGTCTGEHGIGVGKIDYLVDELGLSAVSTMAAVKSALDPNGIMNPGKIFERC